MAWSSLGKNACCTCVNKLSTSIKVFVSIFAGALYPLGFAPKSQPLFLLLSLLFLFWLWDRSRDAKESLILGYSYGLGCFAIGTSWIFISLHEFGNMHAVLAVATTIVFIAILSLYPALVGIIFFTLRGASRELAIIFLLPSAWVLGEWMRSHLFTGFPWLLLGHSQATAWPGYIAPILGSYGVTWLILFCCAFLYLLPRATIRKKISYCLSLFLVWLAVGIGLEPNVTTPSGEDNLEVAIIPSNNSIEQKWNPERYDAIINAYQNTSDDIQSADLIIWPEAAIPGLASELSSSFWQRLHRHHADFIFGAIEQSTDRKAYYNSAAIVVDGKTSYYRKQHLVPFGEYIPFLSILGPLLQKLQIPASNLSSWELQQEPAMIAGTQIGISICYEDIFPRIIRSTLPNAELLVNITEDAWFGNSWAAAQHLQISQMRALEFGRYLIRASNAGYSAIIDANGELVQVATPENGSPLSGRISKLNDDTFYRRFGDIPVVGFIILCLTLFASSRYRRDH